MEAYANSAAAAAAAAVYIFNALPCVIMCCIQNRKLNKFKGAIDDQAKESLYVIVRLLFDVFDIYLLSCMPICIRFHDYLN